MGNYDSVDRYLQWNAAAEVLEGHAVYRDRQAGSSTNQCYVQSFAVRFPSVRLDALKGRLIVREKRGREIIVGHLSPGLFGDGVELAPNVELTMHRHSGHLYAALVQASE